MSSKVVVTDNDGCAPSQGSLEPKDEIIAEVGDNIAEVTLTQGRRREERGGAASTAKNKKASTSMGKRRNISKTKRLALSYIQELREAVNATKPPPAVTITETVKVISNIEEIRADRNLYFFALNYMMDKNNREVFMSIPPDIRVWWIRTSYNKRPQ